jgi:chromosome segregation ATPase
MLRNHCKDRVSSLYPSKSRIYIMKKLIAFCCIITAFITITYADADPSAQYTDAFLDMREAERAESNADWALAKTKYQAALDLLQAIRQANPSWNTTMVETRLKDCTEKLKSVTDKVPAPSQPTPPPAPEATPAPSAEATPAPAPAASQGALNAEFKAPDATEKLRADLARTNDELTRLKTEQSDLLKQLNAARSEAQEAASGAPRIKMLTDENAHLLQQLASDNKLITDLRSQIAAAEAKNVGTDDVNKLRAQLSDTTAKTKRLEASQTALENQLAEQAKQLADAKDASARAVKLQQDNENLTTQVATLTKQVQDLQTQVTAKNAGSSETASLNQKIATLEKQNTDLKANLTAAEQKAAAAPKVATKTIVSSDTDELKKLRAELETAQAELARTTKSTQSLQKENTGLDSQLADARAEISRLKAESDKVTGQSTQNFGPAPRASEDTGSRALNQKIASLEKQNDELRTQLETAKKTPKIVTTSNEAELKTLRDQLTKTRAQLAEAQRPNPYFQTLQEQNAKLNDDITKANKQIAALKKQLTAKPTAAPATESSEVKALRAELADAKAQLANAQKTVTVPTQNFGPAPRASETEPRIPALEQQIASLKKANADLAADLAAAEKKAAQAPKVETRVETKTVKVVSSDTEELNKLRTALAEAEKKAAAVPKVETKTVTVVSSDTAELNKLRSELTGVKAELAKARKTTTAPTQNFGPAPRASETEPRIPALEQQIASLQKANADLKAGLTAAEKKTAQAPKVETRVETKTVKVVSSDTDELNKLRSELAAARTEAEQAKTAQARVAELQNENQKLASQLSATGNRGYVQSARPAGSSEIADLQKQNETLKAELEAAQKKAAVTPKVETKTVTVVSTDTAELKKLRSELAAARTETQKAQAAGTRAEELFKSNRELTSQLSSNQKQINDLQQLLAAKNAEPPKTIIKENTEELNKLRTELAATQAEIKRTKALSEQLAGLQEQNKQLYAKLQAAQRPSIVTGLTAEQSSEVASLRAQIADMRGQISRAKESNAVLDDLTKENAKLKNRLAAANTAPVAAPAITATPTPSAALTPAVSSEQEMAMLKQLRKENSYLLNVLQRYAEENPELKHRLSVIQQQSGK